MQVIASQSCQLPDFLEESAADKQFCLLYKILLVEIHAHTTVSKIVGTVAKFSLIGHLKSDR